MSADRPENGVCFHVCVHVCVCVCVVSVSAQSKAAQDLRVCMSVYGCLFMCTNEEEVQDRCVCLFVVQTMKKCRIAVCVCLCAQIMERRRIAVCLCTCICLLVTFLHVTRRRSRQQTLCVLNTHTNDFCGVAHWA